MLDRDEAHEYNGFTRMDILIKHWEEQKRSETRQVLRKNAPFAPPPLPPPQPIANTNKKRWLYTHVSFIFFVLYKVKTKITEIRNFFSNKRTKQQQKKQYY